MSSVGVSTPNVVLASASPRRLELLQMFGVYPDVTPADVDETPLDGEKPAELVERLSRYKALTVAEGLAPEVAANTLVVAADTVIDIDGVIFGKPTDDEDAAQMLSALSGRSHEVVTGIAVVGSRDGALRAEGVVGRTEVWVKRLTENDIKWYIGTGEPRGKAGAYAIQGLGSVLIDRIEGSYQNVVGLSLRALDQLTEAFGAPLQALRQQ